MRSVLKKGKITISITIGVMCLMLVITIFMQFKIVYQTNITSIDTMREEDLKTELANWKSKYEDVQEQYNEVTETLKKYNEESNSHTETKKNLEEELANLQLLLGLTDVEGPGLVITLKDPENLNSDDGDAKQIVTYSELMIIVNYLKDAGAEAISINNQRIVNSTDFVNITKSYIKINGEGVSSPYTINVIGDSDKLKSSLIGTGYVDSIQGWGQEISFDEKKNIEIGKFTGSMETKYMKDTSNE